MVAVLDNGRQDFYVGIYPPTGDYEFLDNQPAIDGVVLTKSTTKADLDLDKVFQYRGQVSTYSKLPTKNRVIGDTYNVQDTGENYAWNGSSWDLLTGTEAVYWRNGALESQGSTLTIDSDKNPISNLILGDITDVTATKNEVNELHEGTAVKNDFIKLHSVTADANELNILDGATLTTTELNYVDGVTSSIQTQLNGKEPTITGGATSITSSNLTKNRAVISNNSGKIAVSDTTSTELGYVHGVTSAIQTQLNGKVSTDTTVNNKALSSNVTLTTDDIEAGDYGVSLTYFVDILVNANNSFGECIGGRFDPEGTFSKTSYKVAEDIALNNITEQDTIVEAIGKNDYRIGKVSSLTTTEKTSLVGAVNELVTNKVSSTSGNTVPDASTVGKLGSIYVDTSTQTGYMCVGIDDTDPENIVYTWKQITI